MAKKYDTGLSRWEHGQGTDYCSGEPSHKLLGPCPDCGSPTFDYGGGWRCTESNCNRNADNPAPSVGAKPDWWDTDINVYMDGDLWCATRDGFVDLMESPAGFGDTPHKAVSELMKNEQEGKKVPKLGYKTIAEALDQLRFCEYEDKHHGHPLEMNVAFKYLESRAKKEGCPNWGKRPDGRVVPCRECPWCKRFLDD